MPGDPTHAVYILTSRSRTLYIGVTNNLRRRVLQHKRKLKTGFAAQNNCDRLVWFTNFEYVDNAIAMEKKLRGWLRARKVPLVEEKNPTWQALAFKKLCCRDFRVAVSQRQRIRPQQTATQSIPSSFATFSKSPARCPTPTAQ